MYSLWVRTNYYMACGNIVKFFRRTPRKLELCFAHKFCKSPSIGNRHVLTMEDILDMCQCSNLERMLRMHGEFHK